MSRHRRLGRDDRGSVAVLELPLGMLLLIPAALVVLTAATWFERHSAARTAADEAARTVVLADSWAQGSTRAQDIVAQVAANHGLDPGDLTLTLEGDLTRGSTVTARVAVNLPAAAIPLVGGIGGFDKQAAHSERVDLYRSLPQ